MKKALIAQFWEFIFEACTPFLKFVASFHIFGLFFSTDYFNVIIDNSTLFQAAKKLLSGKLAVGAYGGDVASLPYIDTIKK